MLDAVLHGAPAEVRGLLDATGLRHHAGVARWLTDLGWWLRTGGAVLAQRPIVGRGF
jgi:hypothetical protein